MHFFNVKGMVLAAAAAQVVSAHTSFTNFYVNEQNMGNGTCVRMNPDPQHATNPIKGITGDDMACGKFVFAVFGLCKPTHCSLPLFDVRISCSSAANSHLDVTVALFSDLWYSC